MAHAVCDTDVLPRSNKPTEAKPKKKLCQHCLKRYEPKSKRSRFCSPNCAFLFNRPSGTPDECWPWPRAKSKQGYGYLRHGGQIYGAHRVAYTTTNPDTSIIGLHVCHRCDEPRCCNPDHLFAGTAMDNQMDARRKGRSARGSRIGNAKLTEDQVRDIRSIDERFLKAFAPLYDVTLATLKDIRARRTWKHHDNSPSLLTLTLLVLSRCQAKTENN